jgi:hypothetical protein
LDGVRRTDAIVIQITIIVVVVSDRVVVNRDQSGGAFGATISAVHHRATDINGRLVVVSLLPIPALLILLDRRGNGRWRPIQVLLQVTLSALTAAGLRVRKAMHC